MACANPFQIINKYYNPSLPGSIHQNKYITVPCGWCLNCRVDKRNFLEDCCNYEFNNFGCGAFVTFTYDDNHIPMVTSPIDFKIRPTLRRDDVKKFLYRLRSKIRYSGINTKLCNPKFKMLYVGEYGDEFQRPHYHFLFFGLDFMACEKLFYDSWQLGLIDSLPIKDGCFRYVLKYLDKQLHGDYKKQIYDDNNVESPFSYHSINFGKGLFTKQIDYIEKNNYSYKVGAFARPLPNYYKKQLLGFSHKQYSKLADMAKNYNVKKDDINGVYGWKKETLDKLSLQKAKIREKNLYYSSLDNSQPSYKPSNLIDYTNSQTNLASKALSLK